MSAVTWHTARAIETPLRRLASVNVNVPELVGVTERNVPEPPQLTRGLASGTLSCGRGRGGASPAAMWKRSLGLRVVRRRWWPGRAAGGGVGFCWRWSLLGGWDFAWRGRRAAGHSVASAVAVEIRRRRGGGGGSFDIPHRVARCAARYGGLAPGKTFLRQRDFYENHIDMVLTPSKNSKPH